MREIRPLFVDVSDLLDRPGATKRVELEAALEGIGVHLAKVSPGRPLSVRVRLDAIVEGIHVSGVVEGSIALSCRRCLREVDRTTKVEADEIFALPGSAVDEDAEYRVEGDGIDLEPMLRDAIVLELPLNPLCRPDCKGLCAQCGEDLNVADCGHAQQPVDVRWEPLRRLGELPTTAKEGDNP